MNHDWRFLTKTVRVTDPWRWYNKDTVEVVLCIVPPLGNDEITVKVSVNFKYF